MGKKMLLTALLCIAVLLMCIGSVGAYMRKETQVENNVFQEAIVTCKVNETFTNDVKSSITIENTGNVEAYLRLRFVTYWIDVNGDITFEGSKDLKINYDTENWTKIGDTYYYNKPVAPEDAVGISDETSNLLKGNITLTTQKDAKGNVVLYQVVQVFAEAIQSLPLKAMEESWGVTVSGGKITTYTGGSGN